MFLGFFYRLRERGLRVTPQQWMTLLEGLVKGLHGSSLMGFYSLSRSILVKDESELDDFDQCFAQHFKGVAEFLPNIEEQVMEWLEQGIEPYAVDPAMRRLLDSVDVEALRAELEKRLAEQDGRHDGGNRWVGTGGTSPFGHSGYHPGGIRVGGQGRLGSAVQVAAERRFRAHRRDQVLDTRLLGVALKKLRALKRAGRADELDVEATIDATARQAGDLDLVFRPPRANNLSLILAMDVGGSMEPYRRLVDLLFSAAHAAQHFKRFECLFFHNCIYDKLYRDTSLFESVPLDDLFHRFDRDARLVMVGDAYMYPGELLDRYGSIDWSERNEEPGVTHLRRLTEYFRHSAWLNPMRRNMWQAPSVLIIEQIFDMYPLTVDGVDELAVTLSRRI